jgi:hypothetical protein
VRRILRHSPSPAMVVACTALLIALTGTSIAAVQAVPKNSVGTAQLKNNAVTAAKIASNAVTNAKIGANAVTAAKVKDASLVAADFAPGELPADGYARFLNGPIAVPASSASIGSLTIPKAGNYLIFGKTYLTSNILQATVTCQLSAGSDFDQSISDVPNGSSGESMSLIVAHVFAAAGTVDLKCDGVGSQAHFVKLSAIRLSTLTNSG